MFNAMKGQAEKLRAKVQGLRSECDVEGQAEKLRKAMKGFGTDDDALIEVLTQNSDFNVGRIAQHYQTEFNRDIIKDLEAETSGNFEDTLVALTNSAAFRDAADCQNALSGIGTDEALLTEILCTREASELIAISAAFETATGKSLHEQVIEETGGDFEDLLKLVLSGAREAPSRGDQIDYARVARDVDLLREAGEKKVGTDEEVFVEIFGSRSYAHLKAVAGHYSMHSKKDLSEVVRDEFRGDIERALLTIIEYARNPAAYFAKRLEKAMDGIGTDDSQLIRIFVSRRSKDLDNIADEFARVQQKSLKKWVKSELSGDFENIILAIMQNCVISKNQT